MARKAVQTCLVTMMRDTELFEVTAGRRGRYPRREMSLMYLDSLLRFLYDTKPTKGDSWEVTVERLPRDTKLAATGKRDGVRIDRRRERKR